MSNKNHNNVEKIIGLFAFFLFFVILFISMIFFLNIKLPFKPKIKQSIMKTETDTALRGKIYSKDNQLLVDNEKIYEVAIYRNYLNPTKLNLLVNLLSIYTNKPKKFFIDKINNSKTNRIVLFRNLPFRIEKNLRYLSNELSFKHVFFRINGVVHGFDIVEKLAKRVYKFDDTLEPAIGFVSSKYNKTIGVAGLEKYYDEILQPIQNGIIKGYSDVYHNIIYDKNVEIKPRIDGKNLFLNINSILQRKIELMLDRKKKEFNAQEILVIVMNSRTGRILTIATSNRYNPNHILKKDIQNLKISHIQYNYEPGSVMKPITLSILLKNHKVNPLEVLDAHNGVWYFKPKFTIRDDDSFKWLSVIQAVIHSSNIVFAQLGLRLTPIEFREGLLNLGFNAKSGVDLPYEYKSRIFSLRDFKSEIHRASIAFGYGLQVNLMQLVKIYNIFNNNGIIVTPKIAYSYGNSLIVATTKQVISPEISKTILNILRKVVLYGTAKSTNIKGLFIAGKTGTAKINKRGKYIKGLYNSTFIGFVNDKKHKYTIGVLTIKPDKEHYFASQSSVPVFKNIVNIMLEMNLLKKF